MSATGSKVEGFDHVDFIMSYNSSEPDGYMDATFDEANGVIHLITSMNHYSFLWRVLVSKRPPEWVPKR